MWINVGHHLAWHLLITVVVVMMYDVLALAYNDGRPTVSNIIRATWMSLPIAFSIGLLVALHFVQK